MILGKKISQHIFPASVGQSIIKGHNINNTDLKPALFQIFPHLKFRSRDFTNGRNKDKAFLGYFSNCWHPSVLKNNGDRSLSIDVLDCHLRLSLLSPKLERQGLLQMLHKKLAPDFVGADASLYSLCF